MNSAEDLKQRVASAVAEISDELVELSRLIHRTPELAFAEHAAAKAVADLCARHGFHASTGAGGLATAVSASSGTGDLTLAFCAEYDALPDIGHACGHNLIAAASVGAAIAVARVAEDVGVTVRLLGTPAEERGGGKIEMLDQGCFDGVHAALMAHPAPTPFDIADVVTTAVSQVEITYSGRASHAAIAPHLGINAGDAMTIAQVGVGLLRQQLPAGHQVHGVVKHGGDAANVIPELTRAEYFTRAPDLESIGGLQERVLACFEAGAIATGCTHAVEPVGQPYADLHCDPELTARFRSNAEAQGRTFKQPRGPGSGSTDMGNVSRSIPSVHPMFGLDCPEAMLHHSSFTAEAATPAAHASMLQVATALAQTAVDAACDPALRHRLLTGTETTTTEE